MRRAADVVEYRERARRIYLGPFGVELDWWGESPVFN